MTTEPVETSPMRVPSSLDPGPRRRGHSLRGRLLVPFLLVLGVATVADVVLQRQVLLSRVDERINADLEQEVDELRSLVGGRDEQGRCLANPAITGDCPVGRNPQTGRPFGDDIEAVFDTFLRRNIPSRYETMITFVGGRPYKVPAIRSDVAQEAERKLFFLASIDQPQRGEEHTSAGEIRYLAVPIHGQDGAQLGVFAVAQFTDLQYADVEQTGRVAAAMALALFIVAGIMAYVTAGRVLQPVRTVTETARQITETDLSRRIDVQGDDEIAALGTTFNEMLDRLEDAFVAQRNFIDDAGHELRTPITIIRGHLELLGDDPQERRETVAIVTDELDRMNRMVDDLLILAKAERPDFLDVEAVDVEPFTHELHSKAAALGKRDWRLEQVGVGRVVVDSQRITQAMMQLAQNATQHTQPGQAIALGSAVSDGQVCFWVADTGPGVAPREAERIFGRFSRGRSSRRTSDGAGLGLSIVRAIAQAHGGRVELDSPPGEGATFTLVLPVDHTAEKGTT